MLECYDRGGYRIGRDRRKKVREMKSGMESEREDDGERGESMSEKGPPPKKTTNAWAFFGSGF